MSSELSSLHFRSIELTKFTQMQEWNFAKPKCEYFFLISYLAYIHYLLIKFGTKLQWDQVLKKKEKALEPNPGRILYSSSMLQFWEVTWAKDTTF